ncbi:MAG: histidine phosphatase family protein [Sulfuricaulis sp.]|uniref:histidine phosphatase family protein n=1 Tax=Sulfuricaulis sp. TaxID=2003553 RepID=UPI0034A49DDB
MLGALALLGSTAALGSEKPSDEALVHGLRAGGYNLYFRHAATDWQTDDHVTAAGDWVSCDSKKMRQLTPAGREAARAVGEAMRALGIPVRHVLASPYCRTVETARALALGPVETTTDIMNLRVADFFGGESAIAARTRQRLSISPQAGTNTVLVAHGNVIRAATGEYPDEAGAVIFRPEGNGKFSVLAHVSPTEWARLAATFTQPRRDR